MKFLDANIIMIIMIIFMIIMVILMIIMVILMLMIIMVMLMIVMVMVMIIIIPALNVEFLKSMIPALAFNFDLILAEVSFDSPLL